MTTRHFEFIRRVGNRMAEIGLDPTLKDFSDWLTEPHMHHLSEERLLQLREQQQQGKTLGELMEQLTEDEEYNWFYYLDFLVDERTPWP